MEKSIPLYVHGDKPVNWLGENLPSDAVGINQ